MRCQTGVFLGSHTSTDILIDKCTDNQNISFFVLINAMGLINDYLIYF